VKFNRDRAAVRSDLEGIQSYREAIGRGELFAAQLRPAFLRSRDPFWSVEEIKCIDFLDAEAIHPLEVSGFQIEERAAVIDELTRHRHTQQVFVPITGPILGIVGSSSADDPDQPDRAGLDAVVVRPGEGLVIKRGTWHTLPLSFLQPVACLSIMHRESLDSYHDIRDLVAAGWIALLEWTDPVHE